MKFIIVFAFIAIAAADYDYYTTMNDDLDVVGILANPAETRAYLDCFEDKGPCTDLANSYKINIREAVQQACRRCNAKQKFMVWTFLQGMKLMPQDLAAFKKYYDPENKYFDALEQEVSKFSVKPILDTIPIPHLI